MAQEDQWVHDPPWWTRTGFYILLMKRPLAAPRIACTLPTSNQAPTRLSASSPSLLAFRAQDLSCHVTHGLSSGYLTLNWQTPVPSPPIRKHLPVDALAHLICPLQEGLTHFPLLLHTPLLAGSNIPPPQLMARTYHAQRVRARDMMLKDWDTDAPPYYHHPPRLPPHPFMGLGKFVAGRIHQMHVAKSYGAARPSWFTIEPELTWPRCWMEPESFQHAMLHCPSRSWAGTSY